MTRALIHGPGAAAGTSGGSTRTTMDPRVAKFTNTSASTMSGTRSSSLGSRVCKGTAILFALATFALARPILVAQSNVPAWPYGYFAPAAPGEVAPACTDARRPVSCARPAAAVADDGILRKLPGTDRTFTRNQAYFDYGPADWYPGDHPPMPSIVARGREQEGLRACALCHYPNGKGKMENAQVAGLSEGYILQQL